MEPSGGGGPRRGQRDHDGRVRVHRPCQMDFGRYQEALTPAPWAVAHDAFFLSQLVLREYIEAAARSGQWEVAAAVLERLSERAGASGTEWALGIEATSRALLSEGPVTETPCKEAIDRLGRCRIAIQLARRGAPALRRVAATSTALNEVAALTIIHSNAALSGFGASQINALAMLFLELSSNVRSVNAIFFGLWLLPFGVLVIKSGFIPRFLGLLLIIAGFSYRVGSLLQCKPRRFNSAAGALPDRAL
jgi:Domain of unknown function (DUF4386)